MEDAMLKVMFLCTGNSCRSQMAEGFARALGKGEIEAYSAGLMPVGINPYAKRVMAEIGIDIAGQTSDPIKQEILDAMDVVITLCGNAEVACPATPPHIKRYHWPVNDPVGFTGTDEEIMREFRRTRDVIKAKVDCFIRDVIQ